MKPRRETSDTATALRAEFPKSFAGATAIAVALTLLMTVGAIAQDSTAAPQAEETSGTQQAEPMPGESVYGGGDAGTQGSVPVQGQIVTQTEKTFTASNLIGTDVASPEGDHLGEVVDLLLTEDNQVAAILVGVGGFLGFGDKEIALEMDRINHSSLADGTVRIIVDYTSEQLAQAPEFVSLEAQRSAAQFEQAPQAQDRFLRDTSQPNPGTDIPAPQTQ
jgi:sporulation protein YlmC with PRC-barrel domain